jgi:hypothetical protein
LLVRDDLGRAAVSAGVAPLRRVAVLLVCNRVFGWEWPKLAGDERRLAAFNSSLTESSMQRE